MSLKPEIYEPDQTLPADLLALRRFSRLMDAAFAIPGTKRRFGLDAAIGLIPGVGDTVGALISTWVIVGAYRHRVPPRIIARMVMNVLVDMTVGAIPLIGDIFDFLWEENVMNVDLLFRHRNRQRPPRTTAQITFAAIIILSFFMLLALLLLALTAWVAVQAFRSIGKW